MSTMQTPPPDAPVPAGPPERRCPRCGSTLAPDQEWCLACGAAAETEIVEGRGWRVPLYLGGGLAALAIIGVVLAILALADREQEVAQPPQPTPSAAPPGGTPSPLPTTTASPLPTTTPSAEPTTSPDPTDTVDPEPTEDPTTDPGTTGTFPGWTGNDGDYTIIIESNRTEAGAEKVAQEAQDAGESVGILNSDDYSSLNGGYWVVFSGTYASKGEAEDALDAIRDSYPDAYVRQIST